MGFKRVAGMFENSSNKGKYLSGKTREEIVVPAGGKFFLFKNEDKKTPNSPDYSLCIKEDD